MVDLIIAYDSVNKIIDLKCKQLRETRETITVCQARRNAETMYFVNSFSSRHGSRKFCSVGSDAIESEPGNQVHQWFHL